MRIAMRDDFAAVANEVRNGVTRVLHFHGAGYVALRMYTDFAGKRTLTIVGVSREENRVKTRDVLRVINSIAQQNAADEIITFTRFDTVGQILARNGFEKVETKWAAVVPVQKASL